jgi:hypothetical protein
MAGDFMAPAGDYMCMSAQGLRFQLSPAPWSAERLLHWGLAREVLGLWNPWPVKSPVYYFTGLLPAGLLHRALACEVPPITSRAEAREIAFYISLGSFRFGCFQNF